MSDRIPQTNVFCVKMEDEYYCQCECCHGTGKMARVRIPQTLFRNGKGLTTTSCTWWMCEECFETFKKTLNEAEVDWGE